MTDCITQPLLFSSLKSKKIQADFHGGSLTSDAGALLLREVDKHLGLIDAINNCIPDPRNPFYTVHQQRTMLAQRIFGIALGYEDLNDQKALREDPLFQIVSDRGIKDDLPLEADALVRQKQRWLYHWSCPQCGIGEIISAVDGYIKTTV